MLELKGIKKDYPAGDGTVHALKGIDLKFRSSEFVSILGPSGCGKTTMLNIIGGLDKYTEGDLVINGRSTKDFKARDWDSYRNHSIGFVFQSYNLIPHQTVLRNVELALTLSGVSKAERRERAKKALEDVGLGSQLGKRPSEMSGGQMQRVAIARALVNNPDIILADEPTGALDTETSVQVMEILKNISKDRLIVMVTHNPELAQKYSSRIIKMLDGEIKDDSKPLTDDEIAAERTADEQKREAAKNAKMPSMSFATSFSLSLKNLFTKKGRTILTAFAGSIGIIGIALVLSISEGLTTYIDEVQEQTLSSYPLTIRESEMDLSEIMETFMGIDNKEITHDMNAVYKKSAIYEIVDAFNNLEATENDLRSFKKYVEDERAKDGSKLNSALSGVQYGYGLDMLIYTKNVDGTIIHSDTSDLMRGIIAENMGIDMDAMMNAQSQMSGGMNSMDMMDMMGGSGTRLWQQMLPEDNGSGINEVLKRQYEVVYGEWPKAYNEIVLVLDENNELDDLTLYALGLETKEEVDNIMKASMKGEELDMSTMDKSWSYEEVCGMTFRIVLNSSCYKYDEASGVYTDLRDTEAGLQYLYDNGLDLKITGIIKPDPDATATMLGGAAAYTSDLTKYVVDEMKKSDAIQAQLDDPAKDVISGLPFKDTENDLSDAEKTQQFKDTVSKLDEKGKAEMYSKVMSTPDDETLEAMVGESMKGLKPADMKKTLTTVLSTQMGMEEDEIESYLAQMSDDELTETFTKMMTEQVKTQYAQQVSEQLSRMTQEQLAAALDDMAGKLPDEMGAFLYDNVLEFSDTTYEDNLLKLGYVDLDKPTTINLYASTFENKDVIEDAIADYNEGREEVEQIKYTDYIGLMMSSITTIINAITYVLIAFVGISLVVSSIMIGVITLISVQERTKEIGILRAIGASKHDVSSMFNAETIIIGFISGLIGVIVTYVLCIPINIIIHKLTDLNNLNAFLPVAAALILIAISVLLTLIAGIIPSRSAAKKDPVVALRTE
ncbi:MAG: ABC transporter ATP-binding protein/permease [Ruminococcus sp.]|nr:ABC transporter ATP-binding protein/permease [Ruminococcus sp.]